MYCGGGNGRAAVTRRACGAGVGVGVWASVALASTRREAKDTRNSKVRAVDFDRDMMISGTERCFRLAPSAQHIAVSLWLTDRAYKKSQEAMPRVNARHSL